MRTNHTDLNPRLSKLLYYLTLRVQLKVILPLPAKSEVFQFHFQLVSLEILFPNMHQICSPKQQLVKAKTDRQYQLPESNLNDLDLNQTVVISLHCGACLETSLQVLTV